VLQDAPPGRRHERLHEPCTVKYLADLYIRSHLARATSKDVALEHLHGWAQRKGITEVRTRDVTRPRWLAAYVRAE
jgi:PHP family Zn ribbon phosphoesterase